MLRFGIYTRGRTGSSAIADELNNHPRIVCHGEILRPNPLHRPPVRAAFERYGKEYPEKAGTRDKVLPYRLFSGSAKDDPITVAEFASYLAYLDGKAEPGGAQAVGWKCLSNHIKEADFIDICTANQVSVLYLQRRNVLRQAISAYVAQQTGVFNRTNYSVQSARRYRVDPKPIISRMRQTRRQVENQLNLFQNSNIRTLVVSYEDWRDDREDFFKNVCSFLKIEYIVPDTTVFSKMTPEPLDQLIENYTQFSKEISDTKFSSLLSEN